MSKKKSKCVFEKNKERDPSVCRHSTLLNQWHEGQLTGVRVLFWISIIQVKAQFVNKEKPYLKQKCQKGLELLVITDASSTLISYMRHSRRWEKKTTKQRLCPWHIRAFPSTSLVLLLRLTWNQVKQTHKNSTNTCYLTEWGYIIQANTFQEENTEMPGQLYPVQLFIKPTGKAREMWVFFGDVIFFLGGPVWEFSWYFLDTSSNQRLRTIFWLVGNLGQVYFV